MKTSLLAAIAAFCIASTGTALAGNGDNSALGGYAVPDFWGQAPAQQTPPSTTREHATGSPVGTYVTKSVPESHGTYLFPPNPYGNG